MLPLAVCPAVQAQEAGTGYGAPGDTLTWRVTAIGGGASNEFNPYLLAWGNYGRTPMGGEALADGYIGRDFSYDKRFSWSAGFEGLAGWSRRADYSYYDGTAEKWATRREGMPYAWIQQLWGAVKYRGVFLQAGMREGQSLLVDNSLSSGDLISGNSARPVAQVRLGLVNFQNIPFTRDWVQIIGTIAYGKMCDGSYLRNHYNYWNYWCSHITLGSLYVYRNVYFRTNPSKPFSVTIGAQCSSFFGGTSEYYSKGKVSGSFRNSESLKTFFRMIIPKRGTGNDGYYDGSSVGSWDLRARYALAGGHEVSGYFQWLWEDGSSMARRNKGNGLWGIEYRRTSPGRHILRAAVAEYIDFRDQSGPIHWAPGDHPGTDITGEATGADEYYNNSSMNSYMHFGMSMGTPFVPSPIYNTDGFMFFRNTRANGFHLAAEGDISEQFDWKAAVSYCRAFGTPRIPAHDIKHNTSALAQVGWHGTGCLDGISATGALSFDTGKLRGNNFGVMVSLSYSGNISLSK